MSSERTMAEDVKPCVKGCGFFGSSQTGYMCSKCFKDTVAPPAPASTPSLTTKTPILASPVTSQPVATIPELLKSGTDTPATQSTLVPAPISTDSSSATTSQPTAATVTPQKNKTRCAACNKKVGLTGIECRCSLVFCGVHRYPEQHQCTFDFKTQGREDLKKVVTGGGAFAKIDRV